MKKKTIMTAVISSLPLAGLAVAGISLADQTKDQTAGLGQSQSSEGKVTVQTQEKNVQITKRDIPTVRIVTEKADVNRMNADQFSAIGFPQDISKNIVAYRGHVGGFSSVNQLRSVPGMSDQLYGQLSGKLAVAPTAHG